MHAFALNDYVSIDRTMPQVWYILNEHVRYAPGAAVTGTDRDRAVYVHKRGDHGHAHCWVLEHLEALKILSSAIEGCSVHA